VMRATYQTDWFKIGSSGQFVGSVDSSIGLTEPKKSVIGTLSGSRRKRSLRTPTVEIQTRFGHTFNCTKNKQFY